MRTTIPKNNVIFDYEKVINEFVSFLKEKQSDNLACVFLSGSFARGDANIGSDLDLFCLFNEFDGTVMTDVARATHSVSIPYDNLEINAQCLSVDEFCSDGFGDWGKGEYELRKIDSVLIYGEFPVIYGAPTLCEICKKYASEILMSIRHYLCVDEPVEKLTHAKIKTFILKPLTFALRIERYINTGIYPLTAVDLISAYSDNRKILVEYYLNEQTFSIDVKNNHKSVLNFLHNTVLSIYKQL